MATTAKKCHYFCYEGGGLGGQQNRVDAKTLQTVTNNDISFDKVVAHEFSKKTTEFVTDRK